MERLSWDIETQDSMLFVENIHVHSMSGTEEEMSLIKPHENNLKLQLTHYKSQRLHSHQDVKTKHFLQNDLMAWI